MRRKFFFARRADAAHRRTMEPSCQWLTRRVRPLAPLKHDSMMFVLPRHRRRLAGSSSSLMVNISSSPPRFLEHTGLSQVRSISSPLPELCRVPLDEEGREVELSEPSPLTLTA